MARHVSSTEALDISTTVVVPAGAGGRSEDGRQANSRRRGVTGQVVTQVVWEERGVRAQNVLLVQRHIQSVSRTL